MFSFLDSQGQAMQFIGKVIPIALFELRLAPSQGGVQYWNKGWHGDITFDGKTYVKDNPFSEFDPPNTERTLTEESWTTDFIDPKQDWYDRIKPFQAATTCRLWAMVWNNGIFSANRMHRATGFSPELAPLGTPRIKVTRLSWYNEMKHPANEIGMVFSASTMHNYDRNDNSLDHINRSTEIGWGSREGSRRREG